MIRRTRAILLGGPAILLAALAPGVAEANGDTQREVQGRVESLDVSAQRLVVLREFRGKTSRVTLKAPPPIQVFACSEERMTLDRVKPGRIVSVFYEVIGADGVANVVVIEPSR
jgi:hypothetical protein